jgi:hypothetical protein
MPPWSGRGKREGVKSSREEGDDKRGHLVSEREGERAHKRAARSGLAGPSKHAWLGRERA